ncbi:hypothetical protein FA95DRAFT_1612566 [Auriscalpium vulgare]|uniref:Uncharacterized protein n=1 Tax=Auriscalpium vulgare TaxID=40419 RepID=A0ACB8R6A7_9AGAM|nr:hypothetical protein FA95DRAFT_1612566 [Auriscalpium vulgare]
MPSPCLSDTSDETVSRSCVLLLPDNRSPLDIEGPSDFRYCVDVLSITKPTDCRAITEDYGHLFAYGSGDCEVLFHFDDHDGGGRYAVYGRRVTHASSGPTNAGATALNGGSLIRGAVLLVREDLRCAMCGAEEYSDIDEDEVMSHLYLCALDCQVLSETGDLDI